MLRVDTSWDLLYSRALVGLGLCDINALTKGVCEPKGLRWVPAIIDCGDSGRIGLAHVTLTSGAGGEVDGGEPGDDAEVRDERAHSFSSGTRLTQVEEMKDSIMNDHQLSQTFFLGSSAVQWAVRKSFLEKRGGAGFKLDEVRALF